MIWFLVSKLLSEKNVYILINYMNYANYMKLYYRLLIYPPPPQKGGISISTDDYCCLEEEQFLNDVIIDFYLK